jgi:hypothetical protein
MQVVSTAGRPRVGRGWARVPALHVLGVLVTVALSVTASWWAATLLGRAGPGGGAAVVAAACAATALIPVAFVAWVRGVRDPDTVGLRLALCLAGYLLPLALLPLAPP